ncbi:MAG TPA: H-X9-DG-CTERM domain-containing protein [Abditibacteriaceae bacterium]
MQPGCEGGFSVAPEPRGRLSKRHFEGTNVLWVDGHAKWMLRETLEADTGNTISTISVAQKSSRYWWGR